MASQAVLEQRKNELVHAMRDVIDDFAYFGYKTDAAIQLLIGIDSLLTPLATRRSINFRPILIETLGDMTERIHISDKLHLDIKPVERDKNGFAV